MSNFEDLLAKMDLEKDTEEKFDVGDYVCCDLCSKDFTTSDEKGGFLFGSKGVGPCCKDSFLATVKETNEEEYIEAWCPENMTFREFVHRIRNGDNTVTFITYKKKA
jgi:hypothetical protein